MIYADIVRTSLRELAVNNLATRRVLYDQLRASLKGVLEGQDPPLEARERVIELRLLEITIRRFEADLRAGGDVMADGYVPEGLEQEQARLYSVKLVPRVPAPVDPATLDSDNAHAASLARQMRTLSLAAPPDGFWEGPLRPATLRAVLLRVLRELSAAQGRLGLFWVIIEPMVLIGMMVSVYIFTGQRAVMNMELIPFAITGVVPWLMIRITAMRVSSCFLGNKDLLALPPISMLSVAISHAMVHFLIFTLVFVVALAATIAHGEGHPPDEWVRCAVIWMSMWLFGLTTGLMLGVSLTLWPAASRFIQIGMRFAGWVSSVFFVSEQFPSELKAYVLWNPLMHAFQLMRSAYFPGYESEDASAQYYLYALGMMVVFAAACERFSRPKLEPA